MNVMEVVAVVVGGEIDGGDVRVVLLSIGNGGGECWCVVYCVRFVWFEGCCCDGVRISLLCVCGMFSGVGNGCVR